jgi:hypothetical protein
MSAIPSIQLPLTTEALIRCTDWLGIICILLRCSQIIAAIYAVFCLIMMWTSLMPENHQNNLDESNKNKGDGQADQPASKPLQLCRRLRLLLGHKRHNLGQVGSLGGDSVRAFPSLHTIDDVSDLGVHKSKRGTMPND